jgi:hypothetical protein
MTKLEITVQNALKLAKKRGKSENARYRCTALHSFADIYQSIHTEKFLI